MTQKPVSSLTSHFERISQHGRLPQSPRRSKPPDSVPRIPLDGDIHRNERSSLDIPSTRTPSGHSNVFGSHGNRPGTLNPVTQAARPLTIGSLKHNQPLSAHALVAPRDIPPRVTVQSPVTPLRANGTIRNVPATFAPVDWAVVVDQPEQRPRSSELTVAPVPNRATKPGRKAQSINRPGSRTSISESSFGSQTTPTTHRNSRAEDTQQPLEPHNTVNARISPFSTPPSGDECLDASVVGQMRPSEVQNTSCQRPEIRSPRTAKPPFSLGTGNFEGSGQLERQQNLAIGLAPNLHQTLAQSTPEQRPALPPRPGVTPRFPSVEVQRTPIFTSPRSSKGSEGAHEPRQPIHTLDPIEQRSHPARISRHTPGIASLRTPTRMPAASASAISQPLRAAYSTSNSVHREANQVLAGAGYGPDIDASKSGFSTIEGLDGFYSNRRPPLTKTGNQAIYANYDTKLFDMCAGRACSAGQLIRVWDLSSGKLILSLALDEREVRATAVAFKLASKTDEEGSRLWVGTNHGDLHEVDIAAHRVVSSRLNAHSGREVVRIHRYQNAMWTLDEDGSLYVWPPHDSGLPTLQSRPMTRKLPRGHTFSIVIRGILWLAVGKDLHIFYPSTNEQEELKSAQQPSSQHIVGEITSGAVIGDQLDRVYFGHTDGKITTYSVTDYTCLSVVNASVYKINCLIGAGKYLWAGYNTGKICVYDTRTRPWKLVKEWHAHEGPVANLSVDRTGLWVSGLLRVGSVSLDNTIKVWDGLLKEDWIGNYLTLVPNTMGLLKRCTETEMRENEDSWCSFQEIEAVVMTWNAGASTPASLRYEEKESNILRLIIRPGKTPDLLVFGFQELVDLEDKRLTASL
ncbi:MAG: hypothetical protein Q9211_000493 [Gyalolechia sp. 1 TL-2023]